MQLENGFDPQKIDQVAQYDAWLLWDVHPACNLQCAHCFSDRSNSNSQKKRKIQTINIPDLLRTLNNCNKVFRIEFTGGGEPFLTPNLVETCLELTKKHYVSFTTNLTLKVRQLTEVINPNRITDIHASFHINELEKRGLIDKWLRHFLICKKQGIKIEAIAVAEPSIFRKVIKYKKIFMKEGLKLIFVPFIGSYGDKYYPRDYTKEELDVYGISEANITLRINSFKRPCNAGYNVAIVNAAGNIQPCGGIRKSLGNIYKGMRFEKKIVYCPSKFCSRPMHHFDPYLFERAKKESSVSYLNSSAIFNKFRAINNNLVSKGRGVASKFR